MECVGVSTVRTVIGSGRFGGLLLVSIACFVRSGVFAEGWFVLKDEEVFASDV